MAKPKTTFHRRFLFLLPIPLFWCVASHFGWLQFLENRTIDWRFKYRGEIAAPVKVVYVDIDSVSIDLLGNIPWSRERFAKVGEALAGVGQVKAVGVDYVFSEKGKSELVDRSQWIEGNVALGRCLSRNPQMVVAASYASSEFVGSSGQTETRELPLFSKGMPPLDRVELPELPELDIGRGSVLWTPPQVGLIDTINNGTRWVALFTPSSARNYYHMALELARRYWGLDSSALKVRSDRVDVVAPTGQLVASIPLTDSQLVEINWFSHWISDFNPRISFSTVYNYTRKLTGDQTAQEEAREFFKQFAGAVVLIGPTDPLLQDIAPTPLDDVPVPRVSLHGNLLKTIVSGLYLRHPPEWAGAWIAVVLTLIVAGMTIAGGTRSALWKATAMLLVAAYVLATLELFKRGHFVLPFTVPVGSAFTTSFAALIWQVVIEEKQKGRIKGMFGTYLSPALVNRMVDSAENPRLGGHEEIITAFFSDIQGFSTFAEKMTPARLVELMNEYLTACTDIVQEEDGTLDKYIGDAVVAIFGAPIHLPNHAYRACVAAQRVQLRIGELRTKWSSETGQWPDVVHRLRARVGLNSGAAIIGNMGSRSRFNYTMMGDNVNLAARMESGAKSLGVYTMVTDSTKIECEKYGGDRLVFRALDRIRVKGRSLPVPVHEIVGFKDHVSARSHECLSIYAQGMERYLAQDWPGAAALCQKSAALEPYQPEETTAIETNPSLVLLERCRIMQAHPPGPDWDGVYVLTEK